MLERVWIPSPNFSSRNGAKVRLIVLHTAEGARTISSLGSYFAQTQVEVSSHTGADDTPNQIGEYVKRGNMAWTVADYNPISVSIELCGFAKWTAGQWLQHPNMLNNCAKWIAEEARFYKIPIVKIGAAEVQANSAGVCQHSDLGLVGGSHHDCGPGFPMEHVIDLAASFAGESGRGLVRKKEESLIASAVSETGTLHLFELKDDWVWYTYLPPHSGGKWNGVHEGVGIAGMHRFAQAVDVLSITASTAADGTLYLFGRKKDGSTVYTYQKPGENRWAGGRSNRVIASLNRFAPAPKAP